MSHFEEPIPQPSSYSTTTVILLAVKRRIFLCYLHYVGRDVGNTVQGKLLSTSSR